MSIESALSAVAAENPHSLSACLKKDLDTFMKESQSTDRALIFPPLNNYFRFLIHKNIQEEYPELATFSVGVDSERRCVTCFQAHIKKLLNEDDALTTGEENETNSKGSAGGIVIPVKVLAEIATALGPVTIVHAKSDYRKCMVNPELISHLVELADFPKTYKTLDLEKALSTFQGKFNLKWVDDTHCIAIFCDHQLAMQALDLQNPFMRVNPISMASKSSQEMARGVKDKPEPYKPRPKTSSLLAKRMITGALGIKNPSERRMKTTKEPPNIPELQESVINEQNN